MVKPSWLRVAVHAPVIFLGETVSFQRDAVLRIHVVPAVDDGHSA